MTVKRQRWRRHWRLFFFGRSRRPFPLLRGIYLSSVDQEGYFHFYVVSIVGRSRTPFPLLRGIYISWVRQSILSYNALNIPLLHQRSSIGLEVIEVGYRCWSFVDLFFFFYSRWYVPMYVQCVSQSIEMKYGLSIMLLFVCKIVWNKRVFGRKFLIQYQVTKIWDGLRIKLNVSLSIWEHALWEFRL